MYAGLLKVLRNYKTKFIFLSTTKISENKANILNCCYQAKQIPPYKRPNLPLTSSIYLVFFSLEMQRKTQADQSLHKKVKVKVAAAKTHFSIMYVIGTTCFDEYFLIYVKTGRHYFS